MHLLVWTCWRHWRPGRCLEGWRTCETGRRCHNCHGFSMAQNADVIGLVDFFPTSLWGFCFLVCIPPVASVHRPSRPVPSAAPLSSHLTTTHLTHNSSHTTYLTQPVHTASWRSCGADCRRSGRVCSSCGRRSTQSLLKELRRELSPQWPRLLFAWQAQYTEPPEGAAARIFAAVAAAVLCVAGAEPPEGAAARIVAAVAAAVLCVAGAVLKELRRGLSPQWPLCDRYVSPQLYWRLQRRCLCDRSVSPPLYWRLQEVSLRQICVAAVILAFAKEVSLRQICVAAVILAFAKEASLWQTCVAAVILAFLT